MAGEDAGAGALLPGGVLITSFDIIFFWVARMMMFSMHFMGDVLQRLHHALVRDEGGSKMSKSKGNVVDPLAVIEEHGTDTLRFTLTALALQGRDIRLSNERMGGYRAFVNKIWNATRFALMRVTGTAAPLSEVESQLEEADRWILSRLAHAVKEVRAQLGGYKVR